MGESSLKIKPTSAEELWVGPSKGIWVCMLSDLVDKLGDECRVGAIGVCI